MRQYLLPVSIGLSVILTALILSNAYKYRFKSAEEISVVGLAEVDFTSDLIVWQGSFQRKSMDLRDAYASSIKPSTAGGMPLAFSPDTDSPSA